MPILVAAGAAAALAVAPVAGASEGVPGPPPPPWSLTPPAFQPGSPSGGLPSIAHDRPAIRRARFNPKHVRRGRRARLHLTLSGTGRIKLTVTRLSTPHRGRVDVMHATARKTKLTIGLPSRVHGKALARGRYRVTILLADALGARSRTVRRTFVVR
jgi:hypothetical protein